MKHEDCRSDLPNSTTVTAVTGLIKAGLLVQQKPTEDHNGRLITSEHCTHTYYLHFKTAHLGMQYTLHVFGPHFRPGQG